ncbi:hypothetical protein KKA24_00760, partial [Patescibacteria group bacterium]|nr:hypothetical protein [Patescibacteria group bacterium]
ELCFGTDGTDCRNSWPTSAGFTSVTSRAINTVYTATTSGILVVQANFAATDASTYIQVLSDTNATPTTVRGYIGQYCWDNCRHNKDHSMSIPIIKGNKYRVIQSGGGITLRSIEFYPL